MIEVKALNGKLNLDDSLYRLPKEDYIDAFNITHDSVEGLNDNVISTVVGNKKVNNPYLINEYYSNPSYSLQSTVVENNGTTQKVVTIFEDIPNVTSMVLSYFANGIWVDSSSTDYVSPKIDIIPSGNYEYRITIYIAGVPFLHALNPYTASNKCIGAYPNTIRNTIVFFEWNSAGYHSIFEYNKDTRTISTILINLIQTGGIDILSFTENNKITSINIYNREEGDLLFFLDSIGRPTFLDIALFKAGAYTPVERDIIDLASLQPLSPPTWIYGNSSSRVNYCINRFFRFKYLWVLDSNMETTCSPISTVEIPVSILDEDYVNDPTKNNIITISLNSGAKNVKAVQLLMSYVNKTNAWSDFQIVETINKADNSISDNVVFTYTFDNSSTYPTKDLKHSILLFDYVPLFAKAQETPNGNVLAYAAITDGYNKDLVPDVVNVINTYPISSPSSGTLTQVTTYQGNTFLLGYIYSTFFAGVPAVGTNITVQLRKLSDSSLVTTANYDTVFGDNQTTVRDVIGAFMLISGKYQSVVQQGVDELKYIIDPVTYFNESIVTITPPSSSLLSNSVPVWKFSSKRNMGLAYFDKKGRTNGILYNTEITFPAWEENAGGDVLMPNINSKIYHVPPIWADSFQFLFTKDFTQYIEITTTSTNSDEADFIYFEVTGLKINAQKLPTTSNVVSYSFQDGDRVRVLRIPGVIGAYPDTYNTAILGYLSDPTINGVTYTGKDFIKVKKDSNFSSANFGTSFISLQIEIYRPSQSIANENMAYYECGIQYPILNPGTSERIHAGEVTNQSTDYVTPAEFNIKKGDSYFRRRNFYISQTGISSFAVQDANIVDNYISAVSSIDGRANVIDINARQAFYGATIRHGQAYQANTNINGLNRFYPEDFLDIDYSYGDIERMSRRDRFLRTFQNNKIGRIPIFNKIGKNPNGEEILIQTDKLLNPVQYYVGDWGIGTSPESLASFNFADYCIDNIRGAILRVSNNGSEPISIIYKINNWASSELPLRKGSYKAYGAFEQRQNNYIVSLEETPLSTAKTISFDEERNGFDSFLAYHPEMMCCLGVLFVTFKNGDLWTHDDEPNYNNFYGIQYNSSITPVFNQNELQKKTYISITELATQAWDCPEIVTSSNEYQKVKQTSELAETDFEELEGDYSASFLRASNSAGGLINGSSLKGNLCSIKLRAIIPPPPNNKLTTLNMVSVKYIDSPLNNK